MLDFPDAPILDQLFTVGDINWRWDGEKWVVSTVEAGGGGGGGGFNDFVLKSGDVMSGNLHMLGNPVGDPVLYIGPWTDTSTNLHQSLFIQHWYDAPAGAPQWVASPIGIQINIMGTPNYYVWGINLETDINTTGGPPEVRPQHVGYATTTRRHRSNDICFAYYGMIEDMSGQNIGADIGFELDINCSGPEPSATAWQPGFGGRSMLEINNNHYPHVAWAANHAYLKDAVVAPGNGHVYVCQTAGTSGATAPVWPTSGTITDGTVTWAYGTTFTNEISRAISIAAGSNSAYGAGIMFTGKFYDACLDLSLATRDTARNPKAVGIRLANQMQIDFSGDGTDAGQSRHQLWWDGPTQALVYGTNVPLFSIHDSGVLQIVPPVNAVNDAAATAAGVPVGGIYRNGSVLMVRVAGAP
jgi:hypothetical protein